MLTAGPGHTTDGHVADDRHQVRCQRGAVPRQRYFPGSQGDYLRDLPRSFPAPRLTLGTLKEAEEREEEEGAGVGKAVGSRLTGWPSERLPASSRTPSPTSGLCSTAWTMPLTS